MAAVASLVNGSALIAQEKAAALSAVESSHVDVNSPEMSWWRDSMQTHDQRIAWWREARFGMFIHWGVYSHLGGTWHGHAVQGYAEHIMRREKIPLAIYREEVAGQFDPVKFDAGTWVKLAKETGMGYMVITSKHHDGFAMFDSQVSDYNVVKATPWHHDPMKDLKAACDKQGIKFGFYYSHAWDWQDPDAPGNDWDYDNPAGDKLLHGGKNYWESADGQSFLPKIRRYVNNKSIPQIRELIAKYHPAILWFDTPSKLPPSENLRVLKATRQAGPDVVINGRIVHGLGDYDSTTDRPAEFTPHEGDWEGIPTTNESYGWNQNDHSHKPASHFIRLLVKAAARGGNLLMNIGPRGDGTIDPADVTILQGIGKWMKVNASSIHGTQRTPLPVQAWGESTRKGNTLYLHVFNWPNDGKLIVGGLKSKVEKAYLLSDQTLSQLPVHRVNDLDLAIDVPKAAPDKVDSVVVLQCAGAIDCDDRRLLLANQDNLLRVFDGEPNGKLKFGAGKQQDAYLMDWSNEDESISWSLRADEAADYDVVATYDAPDSSAGGQFAVKIADQTISGQVKAGKEISENLGHVRVAEQPTEVRVQAVKIAGSELMRLRSITLKPREKGAA